MQYCLVIFIIAAIVSILEGVSIDINDSEAGKINPSTNESDIWKELKNQFHVIQWLANVELIKGVSKYVKDVRVTGTEIKVYVEKSRTWTSESPEQIVFEPLSAPLIVAGKDKSGQAIMLTPKTVRDFLRTFGIWRQVHIYKQKVDAANKLDNQGLQVNSSQDLSALYILF
ncbi:hypothetical protein Ddc_10329 [Ditylenchus destructor]|nr:hypothetical protein Ddc_10329 [Ditylenchus destructor]